MSETMCAACTAYIEHYPIMAFVWQCDHGADEQAFMLAMADAIHGPDPIPEFADPGWRAKCGEADSLMLTEIHDESGTTDAGRIYIDGNGNLVRRGGVSVSAHSFSEFSGDERNTP